MKNSEIVCIMAIFLISSALGSCVVAQELMPEEYLKDRPVDMEPMPEEYWEEEVEPAAEEPVPEEYYEEEREMGEAMPEDYPARFIPGFCLVHSLAGIILARFVMRSKVLFRG